MDNETAIFYLKNIAKRIIDGDAENALFLSMTDALACLQGAYALEIISKGENHVNK
jgi:hypothetical protein